ncbi:MAG: hypothetical protein WCI04_00795 [archaeon]
MKWFFFGKFDKFLAIGVILILGGLFISAGVGSPGGAFAFTTPIDITKPFHYLTAIASHDLNSIAPNEVIRPQYGGTGVSLCKDGNILKWSGGITGGWVCGGLGLAMPAGGLPTCQDGNSLVYQNGAWSCGSNTTLPICNAGSVLEYHNGAWTCGTNSGDLIFPKCNDGNVLKWSGDMDTGSWVCGADLTGAGSTTVNNNYGTVLFDSWKTYVPYTVPAGVTNVTVSVWGGGQGGAFNGFGGGAGGYREALVTVSAGDIFRVNETCNDTKSDAYGGEVCLGTGDAGGYYRHMCITGDCCVNETSGNRINGDGAGSYWDFRRGKNGTNFELVLPDGTKLFAHGGMGRGYPFCRTLTANEITPSINPYNSFGYTAGSGGMGGSPAFGTHGIRGRVMIYRVA